MVRDELCVEARPIACETCFAAIGRSVYWEALRWAVGIRIGGLGHAVRHGRWNNYFPRSRPCSLVCPSFGAFMLAPENEGYDQEGKGTKGDSAPYRNPDLESRSLRYAGIWC